MMSMSSKFKEALTLMKLMRIETPFHSERESDFDPFKFSRSGSRWFFPFFHYFQRTASSIFSVARKAFFLFSIFPTVIFFLFWRTDIFHQASSQRECYYKILFVE